MLPLSGCRVGLVAADGIDDFALSVLREGLRALGAEVRLHAEGGAPVVAAPPRNDRVIAVDGALAGAAAEGLSAVIFLPGLAAADVLRQRKAAVELAARLAHAGRPVATVGHAVWVALEAGLLRHAHVAAPTSVRTDVRLAGGFPSDEPAVADGVLVTARDAAAIEALLALLVRAMRRAASQALTREQLLDERGDESFPASDPPPGPGSV